MSQKKSWKMKGTKFCKKERNILFWIMRKNQQNYEVTMPKTQITTGEAKEVGDKIGVDFEKYDIKWFLRGMEVELEHGSHDPQTNVTNDDLIVTGKIALARMKEFPDYYERLEKMEREAENKI